jgi:hypothetical protein
MKEISFSGSNATRYNSTSTLALLAAVLIPSRRRYRSGSGWVKMPISVATP